MPILEINLNELYYFRIMGIILKIFAMLFIPPQTIKCITMILCSINYLLLLKDKEQQLKDNGTYQIVRLNYFPVQTLNVGVF